MEDGGLSLGHLPILSEYGVIVPATLSQAWSSISESSEIAVSSFIAK